MSQNSQIVHFMADLQKNELITGSYSHESKVGNTKLPAFFAL
jgi:hypothetical protein